MKISFFLKLLFLFLSLTVSADIVRENYEVRRSVKNLIFAPVMPVEMIISQKEFSHRVKIKSIDQKEFHYLLFLNEEETSFPIAGEGNYIIKRDISNGRFIQVKIFYRNNPYCFLRLFPLPDKKLTQMDVYLFGVPVYKNIILPSDFNTLLTGSFNSIMDLSTPSVNWPLLLYKGHLETGRENQQISISIRTALSELNDSDDGAMDSEGRFVKISDGSLQNPDDSKKGGLNCSGFAKWVVDGFYYVKNREYLDIEPLKQKHLDFRGNRWSLRYEQERDPYFGLDWSRNLAILHNQDNNDVSSNPELHDVRQIDFLHYVDDIGYPIENLELLLYLETRQNPGCFYIGSINREYGKKPVLRQHIHIVTLFPFFTQNGVFRINIFERNQETDLSSLKKRHKGTYIHLVRLKSQGIFLPPAVE